MQWSTLRAWAWPVDFKVQNMQPVVIEKMGKISLFVLCSSVVVMAITKCLMAAPPTVLPSNPQAREYISTLHLEPLPGESGWFGGVNVSDLDVTTAGHTLKAHSSIYYLLTKETPINFLHHLDSDDVHILLDGGPVDYFVFHPDGTVEQQTLGRNLKAGEHLMISVPGGCWKALRLRPEAPYALVANVLSPQWTPDRVIIGAGADFISRYQGHAPWATESFLRELIGPNWK